MEVAALIADIVKSKEIINRADFQKQLEKKLENISNSNKKIISPYTITLGDEFQVIYKNANDILIDLFDIILFIYPVRLRVAVGIDYLHTEIKNDSSIGMDGPAFHNARKGIENLKKFDSTIVQFYDSRNDIDLEFINNGLVLVFSEINKWKLNTYKTFIRLLNNKKVNDIYPEINISQRGVYKIINTNSIENYIDFFNSLNNKLYMRYHK